MLNDNQINEIANIFSSKEILDYIKENQYFYDLYEFRERKNAKFNSIIRLGWWGAISFVGGAI